MTQAKPTRQPARRDPRFTFVHAESAEELVMHDKVRNERFHLTYEQARALCAWWMREKGEVLV